MFFLKKPLGWSHGQARVEKVFCMLLSYISRSIYEAQLKEIILWAAPQDWLLCDSLTLGTFFYLFLLKSISAFSAGKLPMAGKH